MIDDTGTILGHYSKTHPVGDERTYLQRGTQYPVFETKLGKIGVVICYDVCFPETVRLLTLAGAELVLVPAAWRASYYFKEWWDLNLACRALDNLVYIAAVNRCGVQEEAILYGSVDLNRIAKERDFNTVLTDRHPEDYRPIWDTPYKEES